MAPNCWPVRCAALLDSGRAMISSLAHARGSRCSQMPDLHCLHLQGTQVDAPVVQSGWQLARSSRLYQHALPATVNNATAQCMHNSPSLHPSPSPNSSQRQLHHLRRPHRLTVAHAGRHRQPEAARQQRQCCPCLHLREEGRGQDEPQWLVVQGGARCCSLHTCSPPLTHQRQVLTNAVAWPCSSGGQQAQVWVVAATCAVG